MQLILLLIIYISGCCAFYSFNSDVITLNPGNFDKLVLHSDEVWMVEFFAPWCIHCERLAPVYEKAARVLKGVVKVGAVNGHEHHDLCARFLITSFPTVKIFGNDKNNPIMYKGDRSAQGFAESALVAVNAKINARLSGGGVGGSQKDDVIELSDENFARLVLQSDDIWLVEFYAPWCPHCKNFRPQWAKAAASLKGKVKVGALNAIVHAATSTAYGVGAHPTIKYFPAGPKDINNAQDYNGPFNAISITDWALEKIAESDQPPLKQIVDEKTFKSICADKVICVISILPHILDCQSKCRNAYLETLATVAGKHKEKAWGWGWAEAGAQPDLEETLEIGGSGYPAMAAVSTRRLKFSILRGSFSSTGIEEFLRDVYYGRGNISPLQGEQISKMIAETGLWDGKDEEMPVEYYTHVSDVDLDEKDEL